jgi:hypothetical protein
MNNAKPFIVLALILGLVAAVGEVFFVIFGGKSGDTGITAESINLLPEAINVEQLTTFTDRAERYLVLTPKQFEDGVDPTVLEISPTPTVTPTL